MESKHLSRGAQIISSISLAFFADVPTINLIVSRVLSGEEESMLTRFYALALGFVVLSSLSNLKYVKKPLTGFWLLLISVLFAYFLTSLLGVDSALNPIVFWLYTIVSFLIPQFVFPDVKTVIKAMAIMPTFGILFLSRLFQANDSGSISMDLTYSFLIPIMASIIYAFLHFKKEKLIGKLFMSIVLVINLIYLFYCLLLGSRAPGLSIILCIIFMLCISITPNALGYKIKKSFFVWCAIVIIVFLNFGEILYIVEGVFRLFNLDSYNIDKMIMLYELGDLSDGRSDIISLAWAGIADSPIIGHGLSASERFTGYEYPHNFVLQLLLDGGVLLFLVFMLPMIFGLIRIKKNATFDEFAFITILFFASVPGALFSLDLWANSRLWMFMGFLLSGTFHINCRNAFLSYRNRQY